MTPVLGLLHQLTLRQIPSLSGVSRAGRSLHWRRHAADGSIFTGFTVRCRFDEHRSRRDGSG
jgi:hypothetical protein